MLERIGATWPVRPLLLCAGAANTHISSFCPHPCYSLLCAGAVHTQLMLERMITPSPEGSLFLCAGAVNTHIWSFWTPVATPWLLQSCPHGPYWGPLGVLTASLDDPSRSSGAFPVPPVLYVITLGALTASLDDPSRSSGSFPGHRVL